MVEKRLEAIDKLFFSFKKCSGFVYSAFERFLELVVILSDEVLSKASPRYIKMRIYKVQLEIRKRLFISSPNMSQLFPNVPEFEIDLV